MDIDKDYYIITIEGYIEVVKEVLAISKWHFKGL